MQLEGEFGSDRLASMVHGDTKKTRVFWFVYQMIQIAYNSVDEDGNKSSSQELPKISPQ